MTCMKRYCNTEAAMMHNPQSSTSTQILQWRLLWHAQPYGYLCQYQWQAVKYIGKWSCWVVVSYCLMQQMRHRCPSQTSLLLFSSKFQPCYDFDHVECYGEEINPCGAVDRGIGPSSTYFCREQRVVVPDSMSHLQCPPKQQTDTPVVNCHH